MKKTWQKPKLVILYRAKPEESVLAACKANIGGSTGPLRNKCRVSGKINCSALAPS